MRMSPSEIFNTQPLASTTSQAGSADEIVNRLAPQYGFDPNFVRQIVKIESGGNPNALSPKQALGLMQVTPIAAADVGADYNKLTDPEYNINTGLQFLAKLRDQYKIPEKDLAAAYHDGPGNYQAGIQGPEGKAYVEKVGQFASTGQEASQIRSGKRLTPAEIFSPQTGAEDASSKQATKQPGAGKSSELFQRFVNSKIPDPFDVGIGMAKEVASWFPTWKEFKDGFKAGMDQYPKSMTGEVGDEAGTKILPGTPFFGVGIPATRKLDDLQMFQPTKTAPIFSKDWADRVVGASAAKFVPATVKFFYHDAPGAILSEMSRNARGYGEIFYQYTKNPFLIGLGVTSGAMAGLGEEMYNIAKDYATLAVNASGSHWALDYLRDVNTNGKEEFLRSWESDPIMNIGVLTPIVMGARRAKLSKGDKANWPKIQEEIDKVVSEEIPKTIETPEATKTPTAYVAPKVDYSTRTPARIPELNIKPVDNSINLPPQMQAMIDRAKVLNDAAKKDLAERIQSRADAERRAQQIEAMNQPREVVADIQPMQTEPTNPRYLPEQLEYLTSEQINAQLKPVEPALADATSIVEPNSINSLVKSEIKPQAEPIKSSETVSPTTELPLKAEPIRPNFEPDVPKEVIEQRESSVAEVAETEGPKKSALLEEAGGDPRRKLLSLQTELDKLAEDQSAYTKAELAGKLAEVRSQFDSVGAERYKSVFDSLAEQLEQAGQEVSQENLQSAKAIRRRNGQPTKLYSGPPIDRLAKEFLDTVIKLRGAKEQSKEAIVADTKRRLGQMLLDPSRNAKNTLSNLGPAGQEAMYDFINIRGGSHWAKDIIHEARKTIYRGLDDNNRDLLNAIIYAKRVQQVEATRPNYIFPDKKGASHASAFLANLERLGLSADKVADLNARADNYFSTMRDLLRKLQEEGLIDEKTYNHLKDFNYSHFELVDKIDPKMRPLLGKQKVDVRSSGIERLKQGTPDDKLEINSEILLEDVAHRVTGRIMRNRANAALAEVAKSQADNPVVSLGSDKVLANGKTLRVGPRGWYPVEWYDSGKKSKLFLEPKFAEEWILPSADISSRAASFIRAISGGNLVRLFATGINIPFAIAQLPVDLVNMWLTSGVYVNGKWVSLYDVNPVKSGMQITSDLVDTAYDAFTRTGRYKDYITEGGGMELLARQGWLREERIAEARGLSRKVREDIGAIENVLSYMGVALESWSRLASRERAIKLGVKPEIATATARSRIDYGVSGSFTKIVDAVVPYVNANIQATRGIFRAFKNDPKTASAKAAQAMTFAAGLWLYNYYNHKDDYASLSPGERIRYYHFHTGGSYIDEFGVRRAVFFRIAKDLGVMFFSSLAENLMASHLGEKADWAGPFKSLAGFIPLEKMTAIPIIQAYVAAQGNFDIQRGENVWKGGPVEPSAEWNKNTPPFFKDLGQATGLSPERTKATLEKLFTDGGMYSYMLNGAYNKLLADLPESTRDVPLWQALKQVPLTGKFLAVGNPANEHREAIDEAEAMAATKRHLERVAIDIAAEGYLYKGTHKFSDVLDTIRQEKDPKVREAMKERFVFQKKLKTLDLGEERSFWLSMQHLQPEARARVFRERWKAGDAGERTKLMRDAARIGGILTDDFKTAYAKLVASGE